MSFPGHRYLPPNHVLGLLPGLLIQLTPEEHEKYLSIEGVPLVFEDNCAVAPAPIPQPRQDTVPVMESDLSGTRQPPAAKVKAEFDPIW